MRHIAIIGSVPAGYYTAEAAQKAFGDDVRVDVFDRLPVPYGLIRSGVAPDHQSIKAVSKRYEGVALAENVRFIGAMFDTYDVPMVSVMPTDGFTHACQCEKCAPQETPERGISKRASPSRR